jgi:hypothetical protein
MFVQLYLVIFGATSSASGGGGGGYTPALKFNDARNSQYIGQVV